MANNRKNPQIVTIGGGTGAPTIIRSLVAAGYRNIKAVTASTDSGGRSGLVRTDERDRVISIGDWANCLFALIDEETNGRDNIKAFFELASFNDGRKRNIGYSIFYGLLEMYENNFTMVQKHIARLLEIKFCGLALPVSTKPTHLFFETKNGNRYQGEHDLDVYQMSRDEVINAWIDPVVNALGDAASAIEEANYIIYCPGSLYGSLIANLFPTGISSALRKSKARKILIPNLVSDRNQTHHFDISKYYEVLGRYTGLEIPFEMAIVPDKTREEFESEYALVAKRYRDEYAYMLDLQPDGEWQQTHKVEIMADKIMTITPNLRMRHDPKTLAKLWKKILK